MALQPGTTLRTSADWQTVFINLGIPEANAATYSTSFAEQQMTEAELTSIDRDLLKECGVSIIAHQLKIMKIAAPVSPNQPSASATTQSVPEKPRINGKLPQIISNMTKSQFRLFKSDWDIFKELNPALAATQLNVWLYQACDDTVRKTLLETVKDFKTMPESDLLQNIERIVTKHSNPWVHKMKFTDHMQQEGETIQDFVIRLKSLAIDCEFSCPSPDCDYDQTESRVLDQFLKGLRNKQLQADILAKSTSLQTLELTVKHAESFEAAVSDQAIISNDVANVARLSDYQRNKRETRINNNNSLSTNQSFGNKQYYRNNNSNTNNSNSNSQSFNNRSNYNSFNSKRKWSGRGKPCCGCGSNGHGNGDRSRLCPAWNQACGNCGKLNHFAKVCREQPQGACNEIADNFIEEQAHAFASQTHPTPTPHKHITHIQISITPHSQSKKFKPRSVQVFPDSGASICIAGYEHLPLLGIGRQDLLPCSKPVKAVGGHSFVCKGFIRADLAIDGLTTNQVVYIGEKVQYIYISRDACLDLRILPESFPYPMPSPNDELISHVSAIGSKIDSLASQLDTKKEDITIASQTDNKRIIPTRPECLPFPPTQENVPRLKKFILDSFASSAFNTDAPFPALSGAPAQIHLKPNAVPFVRHNPIPVPDHYHEPVKKGLDKDVERMILKPVPLGVPTEWCATMVVVPKKNGLPRRAVNYQGLNAHSLRETHHCPPPFRLARQIPSKTKKSVLDAVDGYHSVPLDEASQPLTTFITPWGRYMYTRVPQGWTGAGDTYTKRYDSIIADVPRKVKVVDDTCLWDDTIEGCFYHTWDYIALCAENGVVFNADKFQFCQDSVAFAGFNITSDGIQPSNEILSAIKDFPAPKDLQGARSWFGLVNQVSWAYATSSTMLPFRELVKHNAKFTWNESLQTLFEDSKRKLVDMVKEGLSTFDINRETCIQCDWSKDGIGYLLLQKHCSCPMSDAPNCCPSGWKLVFAGSRFTTDPETRYAPTEGEAMAVAWSLNHAKLFILGCPKLTVVTDHKPLLGIFGNRDLGTISNPRIQRFKEKTLHFRFNIQHCPGKWNRGPDALSRYPTKNDSAQHVFGCHTGLEDHQEALIMEDYVSSLVASTLSSIHSIHSSDLEDVITLDRLQNVCSADEDYKSLLMAVQNGFSSSRNDTSPELREFWEMGQQNRLSTFGAVVLMDKRLVIPKVLRKNILHSLHSAHQGCNGMKARANQTVYWPGLNNSIKNFRLGCNTCIKIAPSQPKEPLIMTPPPSYPYQEVCGDYFELEGKAYLTIVDRFSGNIHPFYYKQPPTNKTLQTTCRSLFLQYGAPEKFCSDGGPQFMAKGFQDFLKNWGCMHRTSSAYYAQSNGRAELGVKTSKRLIRGNLAADGSLDCDKFARAILQYRNTPLKEGELSPARILFSRDLRDFIPSHPSHYKLSPKWTELAKQRELKTPAIPQMNQSSKSLNPIQPGKSVVIQNLGKNQHKRWDRSGIVVEKLPFRKYLIRMDGSGLVVTRNRRFIKETPLAKAANPLISPTPNQPSSQAPTSTSDPAPATPEDIVVDPVQQLPESTSNSNTNNTPTLDIQTQPLQAPCRLPRALSRLVGFNKPGLLEG